MNKKELIKKLQKNPKRYWYLDFFKENGFKRKRCKRCGNFFWTLNEDQEICNDSSCRPYEFIGNPPTKKSFDYFSLWKKIKKFFENEGHTPVKRYPVLCRWFPDLYFTIAGVVDFYRKDGNDFVFELPENPVVILQPSLRFNDIPQVGVSGRHLTCHSHLEQSSLYDGKRGYWKERCIELDYRMLTEILGIKPEMINFKEDAWIGPGAFGYSLEYHVAGLELGNAVFTEFRGTPDNYRPMNKKLIDMGAGFDRFVWISKGTPTIYDALWGNIIDKIRKKAGVKYDKKLFTEYSKLAGILNLDEVGDIKKARRDIINKIGLSEDDMKEKIESLQAIYAIVDHIQTLLFAITDGGIPSNSGGGYNLRVILRRVLSSIEEYNLNLDVYWIAKILAEYWKPLYPELSENLEKFKIVMRIERSKYKETRRNAERMLNRIFKNKKEITEDHLIELYDSHGISPETVKELGKRHDIKIQIPPDIYKRVTEKHEKNKRETKRYSIDKEKLKNVEETKILFYDNIYEFKARVLKIIDNFVILDRTAFYPRGGGQEPDFGEINGSRVFNVEKIGNVVVHQLDEINFKKGSTVECKVDRNRRIQLTQHHTATHIINASCRKVLGNHVWQSGAKKDVDKAHLDISHYKSLSEEETKKIEEEANEIVKKNYKVTKEVLKRPVAERKYGFRIYQGAAVPSKVLRIISIDNIDHEACAGTHVNSTKDVEKIIILKTEKPHDGNVRLIYVAGNAAKKYIEKCNNTLEELKEILGTSENELIDKVEKFIETFKKNRKKIDGLKEKIAKKKTKDMKFKKIGNYKMLIKEIEVGRDELQKISLNMSERNTIIFLFGLDKKKINLFASAGKDVDIDVGKIIKEISEFLGGKGGGSQKLGQGFGIDKEKIPEAKKRIEGIINEQS